MIPKLLVLCSRLNLDHRASAQVEELLRQQPVDWDEFFSEAVDEGVICLVNRHLQNYPEYVPASVRKRMQDQYFLLLARNLRIYQKLRPVFEAVYGFGLDAAVIKGLRLAEKTYRNVGLRPFVDIDLMVRLEDWSKIADILKSQGFSGDFAALKKIQESGQSLYWTFRPALSKDDMEMELHFNFPGLLTEFGMEDDLWRNTLMRSAEGIEFKILSDEYELCMLCLHAAQHSFSRLIWMTDIAELASGGTLNWQKVLEICRHEKIQAPVYYGLYLVNVLWPGTIGEDVLQRFEVTAFERRLLRLFWPEHQVLSRDMPLAIPMHAPTFFSLIARKKLFLAAKTIFEFYFPPRYWIEYYYKIPRNSMRMFKHYLWRLYRPVHVLVRRILRIG